MTNHPDDNAIDLDALALTASGAKQLIRYATAAEEKRYRELFPGEFNCLPVVVTVTGIVDGAPVLRWNFWPFSLPIGCGRPELPTSQEAIADVDAGRGVVMETTSGFVLVGRQAAWSWEQLQAAAAYVQSKKR